MKHLLLLFVVALLGCPASSNYPPPEVLDAAFTACDDPDDCVVVELGCCDECNGGEARSVAADQEAAVRAEYAEVCGPGTACTEIGCAPWVTTCLDNVCGLERAEQLGR